MTAPAAEHEPRPGPIGSTGLLRMAALPLSTLAPGGAGALNGLLAELDDRDLAYRRRAADLADRIGRELVPRPGLTRAERGTALRVRRQLHQGAPAPAQTRDLAALAARLGAGPDLAPALEALLATAGELSRLRQAAEAAVADEERRLLALPWQLLHRHPAGRHAASHGDITVYHDIADRVCRGEPWTTKRMRQRSDYLWRMLARGSTRATPRGWLAHVAPLAVTGRDGWPAGGTLVVRDRAAAELVDNLDEFRAQRATGDTLLADDRATVAIAPLSWRDAEQVSVWLVEGNQRTRLVAARLRRGALLDAVWATLATPRPVAGLLDALAGTDQGRRAALRRFLAHLARVGAVQVAAAPTAALTTWQPVGSFGAPGQPALRRAATTTAPFLDVYRAPVGGPTAGHAAELAALAGQALRVMALIDRDGPAMAPPLPPSLTRGRRRLLDVVAECVADEDAGRRHAHRHDWPMVVDAHSGYARLHHWIDGHLPASGLGGPPSIDIGPALLDALAAPEQQVDWPTDLLLRPLAGGPGQPVAVLADLAPAGVLDARFLPALHRLGTELPQVDAYRRFLHRLGELTDTCPVELLIPPLAGRAANAVRRPRYTRVWTGDPDPTGYFPADDDVPPTYLPLADITLRADGDRAVAEADGRRIWPLLHTARVARPPWDVVRSLLLRASPQADRRQWRPLRHSLTAWPTRQHVPRITVAGRLVLTPAQWRIDRAALGDTGDRPLDRARALVRLRRRLELPRWITLAGDPHDEPVAVDLESLQALRILDRFPAAHRTLLASELLPGPGQQPVRDEATGLADGHLAELLFRLPYDVTPEAAARLAEARLTRPPGTTPGAPPAHPGPVEATALRKER